MPTYEKNKKHIYKWREKNLTRNRELNLKYKRWKTIQMIYLAILL
jgi:hypothetical protein